jgi:hypothetical protein
MLDEELYINALLEVSDKSFNEKKWLIKNFELYKTTLIWPINLPPIRRSNLNKGSLIEKFNSTYAQILSEFEHSLNNKNQTLIINDKKLLG